MYNENWRNRIAMLYYSSAHNHSTELKLSAALSVALTVAHGDTTDVTVRDSGTVQGLSLGHTLTHSWQVSISGPLILAPCYASETMQPIVAYKPLHIK